MTELVADGRLRSAGVASFQPEHLDRIITETGVVPVANQIEVHPYFKNDAARAASRRHDIAVEAFAPLGHGQGLLNDESLGRIAMAHGRTTAQIALRWHIQHGHIVFPKSVRRERMQENLAIFDFELSDDDVAAIDGLDHGESGRIGPNPDTYDWIPSAPIPTVR